MRPRLWLVVGSGMVAVSLLAMARITVVADLVGFCSNDPLSADTASANGHRAFVYVRSCGATTGYGYGVSLIRWPMRTAYGPGNVFFAEWPRSESSGDTVYVPLAAEWLPGDTLLIRYDRRLVAHEKVTSRSGVAIRYREF
jgi:hypothetical protein